MRIDGKLTPATWPRAFAAIAAKVKAAKPERIGALAGDLASVEEMFALKGLMDKLGAASVDCRQDGSKLDPKWGRASYLFNSTIAGIDAADAIMIIGSNPRLESPVLNARIRKRWLRGDCLIGVVGERADLTYGYNYLGAGPDSLARFADHPPANKTKPMFILGAGAFARPDGAAILALAAKAAVSLGVVKDGWNGFNVLHSVASRVGGLDLGLVPGAGGLDARAMVEAGALDVLFNLGADEIEIAARRVRRLYRHAWRQGRASRRRDSARRRLYRKDGNSMSTWKADRNSRSARYSRPATPARTGRSCARFPRRSARNCRSIRRASCAPRSRARIPISPRSMSSRRPTAR